MLSLSGLWSNGMFTVQQETNKSWSPATLTICLPPDLNTDNKQSIFTAEKMTMSSRWWRSPLPFSTVCRLSWSFSWTRKSWDYSNHYYLDKSGSEICLPRPSEVSRSILDLVCMWLKQWVQIRYVQLEKIPYYGGYFISYSNVKTEKTTDAQCAELCSSEYILMRVHVPSKWCLG